LDTAGDVVSLGFSSIIFEYFEGYPICPFFTIFIAYVV